MKTITREVKLYEFEELTPKAQNRVLEQTITAISELTPDDPAVVAAYKKSERLQTPWFFHQIMLDDNRERIMEEVNEAYYSERGNFEQWKNATES